MEQTVHINLSPQDIVDGLWELDSKQVAEVFNLWTKKFDDKVEQARLNKEPVHIFDLPHFMLYVIKDMDDEGKKIISSMYANLVYLLVDDVCKQHILI